ncbi:MAG: hypothetical protein LC122_12760 [Chitinophagales bacterium]|nr:hypothetical protein [Chitinophagales bacterium]
MDINLEEIDYCKFRVNVIASKDEIDKKREDVLDIFKSAPIKGFRKGKAPADVIKHYYKSQIEESLKKALTEDAFYNTLFEKNMKHLGSPSFESIVLSDKFYCTFVMDKRPDFELKQYRNLEIPKPEMASAVEIAAKKMQDLREAFGEVKMYEQDDFVENGDKIIVNYQSFDGDNKVDQLSEEGGILEVGKNVDTDFSDNILGMKAGETREFNYYVKHNALPSVANKTLKVVLTVISGTKLSPHPIDDELAKKYGKSSVEELQSHLNELASATVASKMKQDLMNQVSLRLVENHDFKVQDWLVEKEAEYLISSAKLDKNTMSDDDKQFYKSLAEKNLKLSLILEKIRDEVPEAQLSENETLDILKATLSRNKHFSNNEDFMNSIKSMGPYLQVLLAKVKDEYVLDFILKSVRVVD